MQIDNAINQIKKIAKENNGWITEKKIEKPAGDKMITVIELTITFKLRNPLTKINKYSDN